MIKLIGDKLIKTGEWMKEISKKVNVNNDGKLVRSVIGVDIDDNNNNNVCRYNTDFIHRKCGSSFSAPNIYPFSLDGKNNVSFFYAQCTLDDGASVWYSSSINNGVMIGKKSCVRDGSKIDSNTVVGSYVTIDYGAKIGKNTIIDDKCYIGTASVVGSDVRISPGVILAPGTVVQDGEKLTAGLWAGNPSRFVRPLTASEVESVKGAAEQVSLAAQEHRKSCEEASTQEQVHLLRKNRADRIYYSKLITEDNPGKWEVYASVETNPIANPERRGLVFDKQ